MASPRRNPVPLNVVERGLAFLGITDTQAIVVFVACEGRAVRGGGTVKPGKSWRRKAKAFKKRGADRALGRSAFHGLGHDEPWHPVTNYPQMRGVKHGMRVWAELTFRDWKPGGWQWRKSRVWNPERADVLRLAMSAA